MLTKRERDVLAAVAGTCAIWLMVAGIVTGYALVQNQDARDDAAAREHQARWARLEAQGCRMVACERIGK